MRPPVLAAAVPAPLLPLLLQVLSTHPQLPIRREGDLSTLFFELSEVTRALVGDGPAWQDDGGSVGRLVAATLQEAWPGPGVWPLATVALAPPLVAALGSPLVVWLGDGRYALRGAAEAADPVEAAVGRGWSWSRDLRALQRVPEVVLVDPRHPDRLLDALQLAPHPRTQAALSMLQKMQAPSVPPELEAAFRVWPAVQAALPPPPRSLPGVHRHPAVLAARARAAAGGDPGVARDLALAAWQARPSDFVRVQVLRVLEDLSDKDALLERADAWRAQTDAPDAWDAVLAQADHPVSFSRVAAARVHASPWVRSAAGRWLVHHGLDREAAEEVCALRGVDWTKRPSRCAGGAPVW